MRLLILPVVLVLASCASSGVLPMGDGKYIVSKNTAKFGGGVSAAAAAEVNEEAQQFCAAQRKKMVTQDLQLIPGRVGSMGSVTLQFNCAEQAP